MRNERLCFKEHDARSHSKRFTPTLDITPVAARFQAKSEILRHTIKRGIILTSYISSCRVQICTASSQSQFNNLFLDHVSDNQEEEEFMSLLESHNNFSQYAQEKFVSSSATKL